MAHLRSCRAVLRAMEPMRDAGFLVSPARIGPHDDEVRPEHAYSLAIALIAGAEACGYIQSASSEERADPAFDEKVQAMTMETQKRLIAQMMPSDTPGPHA